MKCIIQRVTHSLWEATPPCEGAQPGPREKGDQYWWWMEIPDLWTFATQHPRIVSVQRRNYSEAGLEDVSPEHFPSVEEYPYLVEIYDGYRE